MSTVAIFGVSGFIGREIASEFSRAGYRVTGLTRQQAKADELAKDEIIAHVGSSTNPPESFIAELKKASVIIDASADMTYEKGPTAYASDVLAVITSAVKSKAKADTHADKPLYIYTSGMWVAGDNAYVPVDEVQPTSPPQLTAWRVPYELDVIKPNDVLYTAVIRPSLVYGKAASIIGMFIYKQLASGKVFLPSSTPGESPRWGTVHAVDLAKAYLALAKNPAIANGQIYNVTNPYSESALDITIASAKAAGIETPTIEFVKPDNPFAAAVGTSLVPALPLKITKSHGWYPEKQSPADGAAVYYAAWKATQ